ncbi:MAG: DNA alkylation repair protein [Patescibacteria group bacterium]
MIKFKKDLFLKKTTGNKYYIKKEMNYSEIIKKLKSLSNPKNIEGMARFGINSKNTLGISIPILRKLAKDIKKNQQKHIVWLLNFGILKSMKQEFWQDLSMNLIK